MSGEDAKALVRRQVLGGAVAGVTLFALHEGCGGDGDGTLEEGGTPDASPHGGKRSPDATVDSAGPKLCPAADYARQVDIADAGIEKQGTSYAFTDSCFIDTYCGQHSIILIHPVTMDAYVALSGTCTHVCKNVADDGCGPTYHPSFLKEIEAGSLDAGADADADDGSPDAADAAEDADTDAGTVLLQDVLYCSCHGAIFNALNGYVIRGPAGTRLQVLKTTESGGNVVIEIPMT
jgi:Rieske Fe-S protein